VRSGWLAAALLLLAISGAGAASATAALPAASEEQTAMEPGVMHGLASWYGARFHGRRTASGARFDMHALTAAHPTLPFGTRVEVRNLATGRVVEVRITDRGPRPGRRIIDLSQAAARAIGIGLSGSGVAQVRLTVLGAEPAGLPEPAPMP
jgi:rare lipoprotein A